MDAIEMKGTYRGFAIRWEPSYNEFMVYERETFLFRKPDLLKAKQAIDYMLRQQFEPIPIWIVSDWDAKKEYATVTSITKEGVWIRNSKGRREKIHSPSQLCLATPENEKIFTEWVEVMKQWNEIKDKARDLLGSMERLDVKKYLEDDKG